MFEQPGIFLTIIAFLAVIGPLVTVHELGHYWVARWCGVHSETFSIGFGRRIFGWRDKHGTEWKVGWLPLGGYVQFLGDRDAVSQPDAAWEQLEAGQRGRSFPAQPVWKRAAIVAAGPITNFLFAILIFAGFAMTYGVSSTPPVVGTVVAGGAGQAAGLRVGDRIVSIDGTAMESFVDIPMKVAHGVGDPLTLEVKRGSEAMTIVLTPRIVEEKDQFGNVSRRAMIGIGAQQSVFTTLGPVAALDYAVDETWGIIRQTGEVLGQLVIGDRSVKDMGGPLQIAQLSGQVATLGIENLVAFAALISINLGFINLLPLPMLDGGHLMFYAYEAVRRKPASAQVQEWAFRFGFVAIVTLMLVVTFNDLGRFGLWDGIARLIG
jgi:regulator of sigma E protease